jgi:hypothetical protein
VHLVCILFNIIISDARNHEPETLSLISSLIVSDQVSMPYKTTGQIRVTKDAAPMCPLDAPGYLSSLSPTLGTISFSFALERIKQHT